MSKQTDIDHYGRVIGRCEAGGKDLSCELLDSGHAVRRYGFILCL
jgi:micrococcal nuclease